MDSAVACGRKKLNLVRCSLQAATEQGKLLYDLFHATLVGLLPEMKTNTIFFVRLKQILVSRLQTPVLDILSAKMHEACSHREVSQNVV